MQLTQRSETLLFLRSDVALGEQIAKNKHKICRSSLIAKIRSTRARSDLRNKSARFSVSLGGGASSLLWRGKESLEMSLVLVQPQGCTGADSGLL